MEKKEASRTGRTTKPGTGESRTRKKKRGGWGNAVRIVCYFSLVVCILLAGIGCGFVTATLNTKEDISDIQTQVDTLNNGNWKHWYGTANEYNRISNYDARTIYFIRSTENMADYFQYETEETP